MGLIKYRLFNPPIIPRLGEGGILSVKDIPSILSDWSIYKAGNIIDGSIVKTAARKVTENALIKK